MSLLDLAPPGTQIWVPAVLIAVGIIGIVVPILPGLLLALLGVLIWALGVDSVTGWVIFGLCVAFFAGGAALKFLLPGRKLKERGVGNQTILLAALAGFVGFFVIPIVGGPIFFVAAIFLIERHSAGQTSIAWARTKAALRSVVHSMGIELLSGLLIALTWLIGLWLT